MAYSACQPMLRTQAVPSLTKTRFYDTIQELMNAVTLDTYKTIQKLQTKGFSVEQAEGIVDALTESELVTKSDLRAGLTELKADLKLWVALMLLGHGTVIVTLQTLLG